LNSYGLIGLGPITSAPFSGNFQNSTLLVDGAPLLVGDTAWGVCESTRTSRGASLPRVVNRVRMPFEQHAFMQQWELLGASSVQYNLDGPFFRQCDVGSSSGGGPPMPNYENACGWGVVMPVDRVNFTRTVSVEPTTQLAVMLVADTLTQTFAASALWLAGDKSAISIDVDDTNMGFVAKGLLPPNVTSLVRQAVAVADTADAATALLVTFVTQFGT
jgi:hypothetical protein